MLRIGASLLVLTDEETNHLQTFFASAQVLDLGFFENRGFVDDLAQLAIIDMSGLHVLRLPWLTVKIANHYQPPQVRMQQRFRIRISNKREARDAFVVEVFQDSPKP